MRSDKIVFIDTETGGLNPAENSLLSLALVVWQEYRILDTREILINDGVLNVTESALKINGIDVTEHRVHALPPAQAIQELDLFLNLHFSPDEKITLGGHNINFDVNFLKHFLVSHNYNYSKRFSHRYVDTATILYYLYLTRKIKKKAISSQEAFDLFAIPVDARHTALGDAVATATLFTTLLKDVVKNAKVKQVDKSMQSLF